MTLQTNARIAGVTTLVYLAAGMSELALASGPFAALPAIAAYFAARLARHSLVRRCVRDTGIREQTVRI